MRGVWVATVANIDWPSSPTLSTKEQKTEILEIIDSCKNLNLNAIFLQVRPCADAFYRSRTEPWSKYLIANQDKVSNHQYDPLKFWITESHKRGIELHAWINPYRVSMDTIEVLSKRNIASRHPEWIIKYGGKRYLNPGEPGVVRYINTVINEIVSNYDVDGIHLDDYFYPYPIKGEKFNDELLFEKYGFNYTSIDDWRRNNVDNTVESISQTIKQTNKGIKFGISPFGIWRNQSTDPQGSDTEGGISNYDDLYADVMGWMRNGWIDYIAPQLYWDFTHKKANYTTLLNWWSTNSYNTPLFIGESLYKINSKDKNWQNRIEMENHIQLCRNTEKCNGNIFFSFKHLKRDLYDFQMNLKENLYKNPAIAPYFSKEERPNGSTIEITKKRKSIIVKSLTKDKDRGEMTRFGVYRYNANERVSYPYSRNLVAISYSPTIELVKKSRKEKGRFVLTYIAPNGQESEISNIIEIKGR